MPFRTQQSTSYPDMSERLNPQFKQTASKYLQQKKQRKEIDKRKHLLSNQVKHYQKLNSSLQKSLEQKQRELQWLKQVRQRYLTSIQNKKEKQESNRQKLEELRMQNTTIRQRSIQNIHDALDQLHRKKSKAHNQVVRNLQMLKQRYSQKKQEMDEANHSMYQSMRRDRVRGKSKVNRFFQKRSSQLTRFYKEQTNSEEDKFVNGVKEIQVLYAKQSKFRDKINRKESKMSKILNQIEQLKRSSHQIALEVMRSSRYHKSPTKHHINTGKVSRTQRTQMGEGNSLGFKMLNVGSKEYIDNLDHENGTIQ